MRWDRFAAGLKRLIANAASPARLAPEDDPAADSSIRGDPFGGGGYCQERMPPYVPDYLNERSDSSPRLGC
jgi:hypothetical protein